MAQHDDTPAMILGLGKPDGGGDEMKPLHAAAEALLRAVEKKDAAAVADALEDAFQICDAAPHEEGPDEGAE